MKEISLKLDSYAAETPAHRNLFTSTLQHFKTSTPKILDFEQTLGNFCNIIYFFLEWSYGYKTNKKFYQKR